jgi:hypothetical protein
LTLNRTTPAFGFSSLSVFAVEITIIILITMDNRKLEEENYHQYATPTSTLSSGFGNYYGGFRQEDNLPEVSVDQSPQALSNPEAEFKRKYFEESEPKYPVIYDDAPKTIVLEDSISSTSPTATTTTTAVERAPEAEQSSVDERKICGLKRRMFFTILVVVLVIIAIAVGGGVGGAMSSKSKSKSKTSADSTSTVSSSSEGLSKYGALSLPTHPR